MTCIFRILEDFMIAINKLYKNSTDIVSDMTSLTTRCNTCDHITFNDMAFYRCDHITLNDWRYPGSHVISYDKVLSR